MKKTISLILSAVLCLGLLAACGAPAAEPTPTPEPQLTGAELAAHYADAITAGRNEQDNADRPIVTDAEELGSIGWEVLGLTADQLDAFAVSISFINVQAYCVGLFKPVEGQAEAVTTALQTYLDGTEQSFSSYLPDQHEIAQNAILKTLDDGTIMVVMCDGQDTVAEGIEAAL